MANLGQMLRQLRTERKMTQEELNEMIRKLKAVGFDVNKLLEKENDSN